jgi:hypothetical protein
MCDFSGAAYDLACRVVTSGRGGASPERLEDLGMWTLKAAIAACRLINALLRDS